MSTQNSLRRFLFEEASVRGEIVQLQESYQQMVDNHNYPVVIKELIGQLFAATSLMADTLKFEGDFTVQIQGEGAVSLAVVNSNHLQQARSMAQFDSELLAKTDCSDLRNLVGKAYMVITVIPNQGEKYQGIVAIDKPTLAQCLMEYFAQSEQLPTYITLKADEKNAAGMLIQVLPSESAELEQFEHLKALTASIKAEELFTLDAEEVLYRLYHEEQVTLFDATEVSFQCRCSRERSEVAIASIDKAELQSIIDEQGEIKLHCDYCNTDYIFNQSDVDAL